MANVYFEDDYFEDDYYEDEMAITPLPDPPSRGQTPEVFAEKGDAFLGALPRFALELDAVATAMTANATNATSETSNTLASSGTKTFQTQIGKSYLVGMTVRAANSSNGTQWMQGDVTGYNANTGVLTIAMNASQGSGTFTAWNLSISNSSSSGGSLTQDFSVRTLIHAVGTPIASALSINLSGVTGNFITITGNNEIQAASMVAGKDVFAVFTGSLQLTYHATNLRLNSGGANVSIANGDRALFTHDGTTVYVTVFRMNGKAIVETAPPASAPVGSCLIHFGSSAPPNYLVCPAAPTNLNRTAYNALFNAIGTTWGVGDGVTTFGMPWFWPGWALVQASDQPGQGVGSHAPGDVMAHSHTGGVNQSVAHGDINNTFYWSATTGTAPTGITGGPANLAAGGRVLICVKYQ